MLNLSEGKQASRLKALLALLGSVAFAFPLLAMLWYRASPLVIGAESLGVRFFLSERILHGEGPSAWVWQGFLTSTIQTGTLAVMNLFSHASPETLASRLTLYAYAYLAFMAAGGATVFFLGARLKTINPAGMALLVLAAAGPIFLTQTIGFYYFTLPDYYVLDVLLVAAAVLLFQHWSVAAPGQEGLGQVAASALGAGLLLGLMVANKLTMLAVGAVPVAAFLLRGPFRFPAFILKLAGVGLAAVASFRLVLWTLYRFRAHDASSVLRKLSRAVESGGVAGGESDFWSFQFRANLSRYSYGVLIAFFLLSVLVAVLPVGRKVCAKPVHYLALIAILAAAGAWAYFLCKRPAGTTFFEGATAWLALGCMALSLVRADRRGALCIFGMFLASTAYSAWSFSLGGNLAALRSSAVEGKERWQMHHELAEFAAGREIVVILPDNSYCYGGVAEALIKGAGDFPGWAVTAHGRPTLDLYAPTFTFRSEFGNTHPNAAYPSNAVLFWVDRPELPPIPSKYARLAEVAARRGLRRRDWSIHVPGAFLQAHALQIPAAEVHEGP